MSNLPIIFESNTSLREYKEEDLTLILITELMPWLSKLLSLTDEVSANRLEMALPAIKTQCIGMGFVEIKKMFEMYVDGKMNLEARTNFFDRILLGKIVSEYKRIQNQKQSTVKKEESISSEEKKKINDDILKRVESFFRENRYIKEDDFYAFDILESRKEIILTLNQKKEIKKDAIDALEIEYLNKKPSSRSEHNEIQSVIKSLKNKNNPRVKIKCKQLALEDYYRKKTLRE